jgi:hypothetical protein
MEETLVKRKVDGGPNLEFREVYVLWIDEVVEFLWDNHARDGEDHGGIGFDPIIA